MEEVKVIIPGLKAAVGCMRVSSKKQEDEGESLTTQEEMIRKYCDEKGWALVHVYANGGVSGKSMENCQSSHRYILRKHKLV